MMRLMMRLRRKAGISCARVQDLVQSYIDGELEDGPERERLVAHLEMCRLCGVEAETYERIKDALGARQRSRAPARPCTPYQGWGRGSLDR